MADIALPDDSVKLDQPITTLGEMRAYIKARLSPTVSFNGATVRVALLHILVGLPGEHNCTETIPRFEGALKVDFDENSPLNQPAQAG